MAMTRNLFRRGNIILIGLIYEQITWLMYRRLLMRVAQHRKRHVSTP
jgi:hypothetical protein